MSKKSKAFTREALLNFNAKPKEFEIKGYGNVFVRSICSGERIKLSELYEEGNKQNDVPEKTVILGICDESGQPLFTDGDMDKIKALPSDLVQAMSLAVVRGNGMEIENVKLAEGN